MLTILIGLVVVFMSVWFFRRHNFKKKLNWVQRIPGYPILGNTLEFNNPSKILNVLCQYSADYNGLFCVEFLLYPNLFVSDIKFLKWFLSSNSPLYKGKVYEVLTNWLGKGILITGGEEWKKSRKILTPAFHFSILDQFIDVFENATQVLIRLLNQETDKDQVNVEPFLTRYTLDVICQSSMGVKLNIQDQSQDKYYGDYINAVCRMGEIVVERAFNPLKIFTLTYIFTSDYQQEKKFVKLLHQVSNSIIDKRRKVIENNKKQDPESKQKMAFLDHLLRYRDENGQPLSNDYIREQVDTVMFAGHDTTATALGYALYLLAYHSDVQEKARGEAQEVLADKEKFTIADLQDLTYLDLVIKETLRLYPSVPFYSRHLKEDMIYEGDKILPKGLTVNVVAYVVNRNPAVYKDPDQFIPTRFLDEPVPFSNLPFSAGPRNCIGQKFAMLEMKVALSKLLLNFEFLPADPPVEPIIQAVTILKSKNGIRLKLKKLVV